MKRIVECVAGSHLFGLNTKTSDKDYKGVYIPTQSEILLGNYKNSIRKTTGDGKNKNNASDVDIEFYSIAKFFKMLEQGQTVALELLFTPGDFIVYQNWLWDEVLKLKPQLIHKRVTAFIGYAKRQSDKYGIRGSRMGTVKKARDLIAKHLKASEDRNLSVIWPEIVQFTEENEHSSIMQLVINKNMTNKVRDHWEVCGRKFDTHCKLEYLNEILTKFYDGYGERAKAAMNNNGIDWKAVSHALRVCHQGKELLLRGGISLPINGPERDFILEVKKGNLDFTSEVQPVVEKWMNELIVMERDSELPESINVDEFILKFHRIAVGMEY